MFGMVSALSANATLTMVSEPTLIEWWGTDTPQPDTIMYDDPTVGSFIMFDGTYYISVRFTPLLDFDLRAAYISLYVFNMDTTFDVWVTGDSGGYADPSNIYEHVVDYPALNGWNQVDFADTHSFNANQDFHIVYGPLFATNDPSVGPGVYPLLDSNADWLNRSYYNSTWPTTPPLTHISGYDWRCRAGGEYSSGGWTDLGVANVDNVEQVYFLCQNDLATFRALIENVGTLDVTTYNVQWNVDDETGITVFTTAGIYGPLLAGNNITVTAPLAWMATTLGEFIVTAVVTAAGDAIPENDSRQLEQQVDDPALAHLLDYDIPELQVQLSLNPNSGRAMEYDACTYPIDIIHLEVDNPDAAGNAIIRIYGDDGLDNPDPGAILFDSTVALIVGNNIIPTGIIPIVDGPFYVAYLYADATTPNLGFDGEPSASSNLTMPMQWRTINSGADWLLDSGGDLFLRAMVTPPMAATCEPATQVSPDINIGVQVDYYVDGTTVPYCLDPTHPPGPSYPHTAAYLAIANSYQDCYLVYINACLDANENHIPGHTGQISRVIQLDFHPNYATGLAFDRRDNSFWCGDWNTHTLYHFADITGTRTIELYGSFPAGYFGLPEMPISGLEMDMESNSLWATTNGNPDMWLEFDVSDTSAPSLIQGPFPILWQSGGGPNSAGGLEYSELLDQIVAINQHTNSVEEFQDVGMGIPTPLSSCNLFYNGYSYGPAVLDGPRAIINDSTYAQGHLYTIDVWWEETGPFPLNDGPPPEPNANAAGKFHCQSTNKGTGGPGGNYARSKKKEGIHENYKPLKACSTYAVCTDIEVKGADPKFKCVCCGHKFYCRDGPLGARREYHLSQTGKVRRDRQSLFVVGYIDLIYGKLDFFESSMEYHDHVGAHGSSAVGYPTSLTPGTDYNRFLAIQDSLGTVTRFSNHPLSVGPLETRAIVGPDTTTEYSVSPGDVITFDASGTASYPPLAVYTPSYSSRYLGFPGDTISVEFEVINAGGAATVSLLPTSYLGWTVVSCPSTITLGAGEYDTVVVLLEIPPTVNDYDADFFELFAALTPDTTFQGMVIRSIPPLDVTIEALANDVVLQWRSSNNPTDPHSDRINYKVWRSTDPSTGFTSVATVSDTTWTDYGILPGNEKRFYRITAGYYE